MKKNLFHLNPAALFTTCIMLLQPCFLVNAGILEDYTRQWEYNYGTIYSCPVTGFDMDYSSIPAGHIGSAIYDMDMDGSDELLDIQIDGECNLRIDIYEQAGEEIVKQDSFDVVYHMYGETDRPLPVINGNMDGSTSVFLYMTDRPEIAVEVEGFGAFATGVEHTFVTHVYDGNNISRNHHYSAVNSYEIGSYIGQDDYEDLYSMGVKNDIDYFEFWSRKTRLREHVNEIEEICRVDYEINPERTDFELRFLAKDELDQGSGQTAPVLGESPSGEETSEELYLLPQSMTAYLTREDIEGWPLQVVNYAKNEIYARLGRQFMSSELTGYFNQQPWYHGTIPADQFLDSSLDDVQCKNADFLQGIEYELNNGEGYQLDQPGYSYDIVYEYLK